MASPFTFRRMLPTDKPVMQDIASRIWEGNDYLPAVFDAWVADADGEFTAVLLDGRVVGCAKLTFPTPADAWLEGLRKDPRVSERGLGRAVVSHVLDRLAARAGLASVRFATYVKNLASITTNERVGFRVRTRLSVKAWEGSRAQLRERVCRADLAVSKKVDVVRDERAVQRFLDLHPYFEETQGLVVEGWKAWPWSPELLLQRFVRAGACRGVHDGHGGLEALAGWTVARRQGRAGARLVFLAADTDEAAAALLRAVFRDLEGGFGGAEPADAGERTTCEVEWMIPPGERYRKWAAAAGLATWEQEEDFLVYELPLETLARRTREKSS